VSLRHLDRRERPVDDVVEIAHRCGQKEYGRALARLIRKYETAAGRRASEISTMCGHSLISPRIARKARDGVNHNTMSAQQGACMIERPCTCGIFNTDRCAKLLKK
jgi:hypothetical protein